MIQRVLKRPGFASLGTLTIAIVVALITVLLLDGRSDVPREAALMSGIFVLAAVLWVTEALPLFATSLLVVGLEIVLIANPGSWSGIGFESGQSPDYRAFVSAAADPILLLFFGGFLLARAAVNEGVDQAMSALLLRPFGSKPPMVLLGFMLVTALFSMWMSNTATTAMMIALVGPMLATMTPDEPFRKGLILSIPFAANIGGMGTPIASPPNAVAVGFLADHGLPISFLDWMLVTVPLMVALLFFAWQLIWRVYRPKTVGLEFETQPKPLKARSWFVAGVFVITVILWLTDKWHGLPSAVVALLPAVAFTASGVLKRNDINSLDWHILILISGGIALGFGIQQTGLDQIFVGWLPIREGTPVIVITIILVSATVVLSTFMSNTAAANLLLPIGISTATVLGENVDGLMVQFALSIALTASVAMALPISTPPNAIAYGRGDLEVRDMARVGGIIGAVAVIAIVMLLATILKLTGAGN